MGNELFELLGVDPDEPRVRRALRDAKEVERLVDTLLALRTRLGISQADLAAEMETTQSAVSKFERAGGDPRISTLQRYASALGARVRFGIDATGGRAPALQANHEFSSSVGSDADGADAGGIDKAIGG